MNFSGTLTLLITFAIEFYLVIVITRFMLQLVRADFYNPLSQFVVKATQPVLIPLRRLIPGFGGIDVASLVLVSALVALKIALLFILKNIPFDAIGFGLITLRSLGKTLVDYFTLTIFAGAILSWFAQGYHPVVHLIMQVSEPVLRPFRRLLPNMGGIDISPMIALLALQALKVLFELDRAP